ALLPFRFAKNPEFRNFLRHKPTEYSIPGPAKIKKLIDSMADEHVSKMKADLEGIQNYTILTDGYSDLKRSYHFYSLHISFIDSTFERKLRFLTLKSIDKGDHLAISEVLNNALNEFGLRFNECSLLTSDAASPLVLLAEKQLIDRVHCGCHQLNLVITDFVKEKSVQKVQAKVQSFARYLSKNKATKEKLLSLSAKDNVKIPLPLPLSPTRWGALSILIDRYLAHVSGKYKSALDLSDLKEYLLRTNELDSVKEIGILLKPIHQGILRLERDESFVSEIIPTLIFVKKQVEKYQSAHAAKLLKCIDVRIDACLENRRLISCMLIDHRYAYVDGWNSLIDWKSVENDMNKFDLTPIPHTSVASDTEETDDTDLDSFLDCSMRPDGSVVNDLKSELIRYHAFLTTTRPTYKNPLVFWKGQCANFPKLSEIARILLASPASAACSERTFRFVPTVRNVIYNFHFSRCSDFIRQKKRNRATIGTINSVLIVNELSRSQRPVSDTEEEETDSELSETDQDTMEDDSDEDIDQ
ncbi:hypothetical protein CRE_10711, partial [Caenorhabditis remanei]